MKTTPEPAPVVRPRRVSRRLATDGDTVAATCVTTREYASSASVSSGSGARGVTCGTIATPTRSVPAAPAGPAATTAGLLYLHACNQPLQARNNSPTSLGQLSTHVNRTASPDMFRVLGEVGLSFTQMKALFLLSELDESSVKDLSDRLSMSVPAMSRSVDGLVGRGFVARRECENDRRSS